MRDMDAEDEIIFTSPGDLDDERSRLGGFVSALWIAACGACAAAVAVIVFV